MKANLWKIATITLGVILIVGFGVYFYLTPYLALRDIKNGFANKDAEMVCSHIDFPKFKENFKAELNAKMMSEMAKDTEKDEDNSFASLGVMFAQTMVNNIIDAYVSPAAIERLMKGDFDRQSNESTQSLPDADSFINEIVDEEKVKIESGYKSFNEFVVDTTDKTDSAKGAQLVFERRGITNWQLVNLKIK